MIGLLKYFKKIYGKTKKDFYCLLNKTMEKEEKMFVVTANPETLMIAKNDKEYSELLLDKRITIVPDGIGVVKAASFLGYKIKERIPGVEIVQKLFKEGNNQLKSIYLFGASKQVINKLIKNLKKEYPRLKISGYNDGYVSDKDKVFEKIQKLKPDIILVALGIPQQEKMIYKNLDKFQKGIFIGVGGSFDVLSGYKKRAPKIFQKLNLEWLYRLLKEPSRIKRFSENNIGFLFEIILIKLKLEKYKSFVKLILMFFLMLFLSFIIMLVTFLFSNKVIDLVLIKNYFASPLLIVLSILPLIILILLLYLIFQRLWLSYSIVTFITVFLATINKFKLMYRDDPLLFEDLFLFQEAVKMGGKYNYLPTISMIIIYILLILIGLFLYIFINKVKILKVFRVIGIVFLMLLSIYLYKNIYLDEKIYKNIVEIKNINKWSKTQQFQIRGFIYPFIYNSKIVKLQKPNDYDEKEIKNDLAKMKDKDIPLNEKVNIIAIMLEAYADFSIFDNIDFTTDIYENFHNIQEQSYFGSLITSVFGGGTINTERRFLTGHLILSNMRKRTDSFVWYLNNQGYFTEAMHPIYGWFYNRRNINYNLGFQNFDYYENKYQLISKSFLQDNDFFDYIIEGYKNNKKRKKPYFNFTVTYQNHGPYSEQEPITEYILKKNMEGKELIGYNIVNNYFRGIYKTDQALKKLKDFIDKENEPIVLVLFGDHKPFFGPNHEGY